MKRTLLRVIFAFILLLSPALIFAGGHDQCSLCHGVHSAKGPVILTQSLNQTTINPLTGAALEKVEGICMACHADQPDGLGIHPVKMEETHPVGMVPVNVLLPDSAKGFTGEEDKLTCLGCHDIHPSNTNYMYLRVSTNDGQEMNDFCLWCHGEKGPAE